MKLSHVILWSDEATPHLRDLIDELAIRIGDGTWVTKQGLSEDRRRLGFSDVSLNNARLVTNPSAAQVRQMATGQPEATLHLFMGIRGFPLNRTAFFHAASVGGKLAIITENRNQPGWKALARRLAYLRDALVIRRHASAVFVNGYYGPKGGRRFFRSVAWPDSMLFPFGYFWTRRQRSTFRPPCGHYQIAFVGQLIRRKGVDVLFRALSSLPDRDWVVRVYGNGPEEVALRHLSLDLGIATQVSFEGACPLHQIPEKMALADVVVVPSRFDGWGMVVNEALSVGVPVLASDACGAQDLFVSPFIGQTFACEDQLSLAHQLNAMVASGHEPESQRQARAVWYSRTSTADVAAAYLISVVDSSFPEDSRPTPPWRQPIQ